MKRILVIQGGGRPKGNTAPPLGRYEKYPDKDCALLMTSADNLFWTFEQAVSYYRFRLKRQAI